MLSKTKKNFVKWFAKEHSMNEALVAMIIDAFEQWIKTEILNGSAVRLAFGKFHLVENKYSGKGLSGNGHIHRYRPKFSWLQVFKEEVDKVTHI